MDELAMTFFHSEWRHGQTHNDRLCRNPDHSFIPFDFARRLWYDSVASFKGFFVEASPADGCTASQGMIRKEVMRRERLGEQAPRP
jgi:hypothetical protein